MITAGDFRNGITFEINGEPHVVISFQHVKPGKGAAFVRTKYRNILTGATREEAFNPSDKLEQAHIDRKKMTYSYNDGELYYFMDPDTYDMVPFTQEIVEDAIKYIRENDEVTVSFFKENGFLVGVSLDGYQENMNHFRIGPNIENVHAKVLENIELLKDAGVDFNILTVVTRELAKHPRQLFEFYLSQGFEYVQLIPCLPAFGVEDDGMSLTPDLYVSFYKSFFKSWKKAYLKGRYINVNLFENIIAMLQGYYPYQCGMLGRCAPQQVVESNGDVFPCDFYCLDEYRMGNLKDASIEELRRSDGVKRLMAGSDCEERICETCRFRKICHGGCQRQNICYLTDDHCAYQEVLAEIVPELYELMKKR